MRLHLVATAIVGVALFGAASGMAPGAMQAPERYYLVLGDSIAYGIQPAKANARPSALTGYAGPFASRLQRLSPQIEIVNYSCPGESTVTFVRGRCPTLAEGVKLHDPYRGPQLKAAVAFLRAHPDQVSPITLTLWGAELAPLSAKGKRARAAIASFSPRFAGILRQLRAAAPNADIIVTGAWNPEANGLAQTTPLYRSVDATIRRAAKPSRVRVVNMFAAFNGSGNVQAQKAKLCRLTFACRNDPHPNDAGYRAMADAFLKASGYGK
jgi:GDSL-like Lipase/Acylhydrolase family